MHAHTHIGTCVLHCEWNIMKQLCNTQAFTCSCEPQTHTGLFSSININRKLDSISKHVQIHLALACPNKIIPTMKDMIKFN